MLLVASCTGAPRPMAASDATAIKTEAFGKVTKLAMVMI